MSLIVALISRRDGIVVSDGRIFGSVLIQDDKPTTEAQIESEQFDKTFTLKGGALIGAFAGLIRFSNKSVSLHVKEIVESCEYRINAFYQAVELIDQGMKDKLQKIYIEEVLFNHRRLDLLLVGGKKLTRSDLTIAAIQFAPKLGRVESVVHTFQASKCCTYYAFGDDTARVKAVEILESNATSRTDAEFLQELATRAVKGGVLVAGIHPYGKSTACGGNLFSKKTYY